MTKIERIAQIIAEWDADKSHLWAEWATEINDGDGWTYDEPTWAGGTLRHEGATLTTDRLEKAIDMARNLVTANA